MNDTTTAKRLEKSDTKGKIYNGEIDFWKLIFAFVIVFYHISEIPFNTTNVYFSSGQLAVEFFFIVSGYFMMQSADSAAKRYDGIEGHSIWRENLDFIWRKIKAILPYHIFAFVLWSCLWSYFYILKNSPTVWGYFGKMLESVWSLLFLSQTGVKGHKANSVIWYVSAMLFVMFVLYPIIRRFRKGFCTYGMPIIAFVLLGYISNTKGSLTGAHDYSVYLTEGVIRAFLDIIVGCLVYQVAQYISKKDFSKIASIGLFILEISMYGLTIFICNKNNRGDENVYDSSLDFVCLLLMTVAVTVTLSNKSVVSPLFKSRKWGFCGKFATAIYFNHAIIRNLFEENEFNLSYKWQLLLIVTLSTVLAFLCLAFLNLIKKNSGSKKVKRVPYAIASVVLAATLVGGVVCVNAYNDSKRPATIEKAQTQYSKTLESRKYMMQSLGGVTKSKNNPDSINAMKSAYNKGERFFQTSVNLTSDGRLVLAKGWKKADYQDRYGIGKYDRQKPVPGYKTFIGWKLPGGNKTSDFSDLTDYMKSTATDAFVMINTNDIGYEKTKEIYTKMVNSAANNEKILSHLIPQAENKDMLKAIKEAHNFSQINYLIKGDELKDLDKTLEYLKENGVTSVSIKAKDYSDSVAEKINETDFDCFVYTIDNKEKANEAIRKGANLVCTNILREG